MNDTNALVPGLQPDLFDLFTGRGPLAARMELGRAARKKVPRTRLALCKPKKRDPIALLEASNVGRVQRLCWTLPIPPGKEKRRPQS